MTRLQYAVGYEEQNGVLCSLTDETSVREHAYAELEKYRAAEVEAGGRPDLLCVLVRQIPQWSRDEAPVRPERIVLSRRRGWRLPEGAVSVARPHRYGNPYIIGTPTNTGNITRDQAVSMFREALLEGRLQFTVADVKRELRGRSLACWCPLDAACHVDVLLDVANT